jgi:hypothetical protein
VLAKSWERVLPPKNKVEVVSEKKVKTFRIHMGLLLAELICIPAFIFEVTRALGGNTLSWAYVFEWPALGGYAIYMWRKLLHEERAEHDDTTPPVAAQQVDDPQLQAWNDYLAKVHALDGVKESENLLD